MITLHRRLYDVILYDVISAPNARWESYIPKTFWLGMKTHMQTSARSKVPYLPVYPNSYHLQFYILFNLFQSYQVDGMVIMKGWDNGTLFMSGRFLPPGGLRPGPLDQQASALPTELLGLLTNQYDMDLCWSLQKWTKKCSNIKHLVRLRRIRLHAYDDLGCHSSATSEFPTFSLTLYSFFIPLYGSRSWFYSLLYWVQTYISWN